MTLLLGENLRTCSIYIYPVTRLCPWWQGISYWSL